MYLIVVRERCIVGVSIVRRMNVCVYIVCMVHCLSVCVVLYTSDDGADGLFCGVGWPQDGTS